MAEEVIIALPALRHLVPIATQVRSTLLAGSQKSLRARGLLDAYLARLPPSARETLFSVTAGTWLPIAAAEQHYLACDGLDLSTIDLVSIGGEVSTTFQGTFRAMLTRGLTQAGATPFTVFQHADRLWGRLFMGSAVGVYKLGPKDMRIEFAGFSCAVYRYNRVSLRGVIGGLASPFCTRAYVREIDALRSPLTLGYHVSWA